MSLYFGKNLIAGSDFSNNTENKPSTFVATITNDESDNFICDKTYDDIVEAHNSGKVCLLHADYNEQVKGVFVLNNLGAYFVSFASVIEDTLYQFYIASNNEIEAYDTNLTSQESNTLIVTCTIDDETLESVTTSHYYSDIKEAYDNGYVIVARYTNQDNNEGSIEFKLSAIIEQSALFACDFFGTSMYLVIQEGTAYIEQRDGDGDIDISDSVTSTSSTTAASSYAVKQAYDLASNAIPSTQKNVANGVAGLDEYGFLGTLYSMSGSNIFTASSGTVDNSSNMYIRNSPFGCYVFGRAMIKFSSSIQSVQIYYSGDLVDGAFSDKIITFYCGVYNSLGSSYTPEKIDCRIQVHSNGFWLTCTRNNGNTFPSGYYLDLNFDFMTGYSYV